MRNQRPRGSTTREAVVAAALAAVDQDGVDGLTIRAVADRVGAPPMSLYSHFRSKEELLDFMLEGVAARIYAGERHPTWQAEMLALCRRVYRLLSEHPRWIPLLSRPVWPVQLPLREHLLKLMINDGIPSADGLLAVSSAVLTALGLVLVEPALTGPDREYAVDKDVFELTINALVTGFESRRAAA
ncbi:MAG TPA: TetR/AcrR family transcriptional regulator [Polyangiaceae bacterium]|jgi:AcrR family transcriptional regulator|nr:TetR/AcrR family transcriptional regulator [Polyangiaceae bacterium]